MKNICFYLLLITFSASACSDSDNETSNSEEPIPTQENADITNVSVAGEEGNYTFSVEIESPDLGCNQYADWWEVISEDGTLIYRRILAHSHVNEQPFTRSGGSVNITENQIVYVRAHMNNKGYGTVVFKGSIANGFSKDILEISFASELASQEPLPGNCAF
ncbi:hypothetical protein [Aquimarina litoralis]|uniref:hypothetical protein n=1 Tax=Aquimarina litoralis TaxID=584605 RepID=UPI001C58C72E|nr:hypothetical protein [Aquimarina litoralis]MBW1298363.1 hypothetical protein [Aquimarina litoralis]